MKALIADTLSRRFVRFALSGGTAAAVNIGSRVVFSNFMSFDVAIVAAYGMGMTTAYVLMKTFVFDPTGRGVPSEYARFIAVNLIALAQVLIVSIGLADFAFPALTITYHPELLAHIIGVLSPLVTSYILHSRITFSKWSSTHKEGHEPG